MAYCSLDDIKNVLSEGEIARYSNDTDPLSIDTDVVNSLINNYSEEIDGYLRGRYALPFTASDSILKVINRDMTVLGLKQRRHPLNENEFKGRDLIYLKLNNIQRGIILLEQGAPDEKPSFVKYSSADRIFNKALYEAFNEV